MEVDDTTVTDHWILTPAEQALAMAKGKVNRLNFALLLLFYRIQGRFPTTLKEIDPDL